MSRVIIDNRYKSIEKIGTGATGAVYKVRDLKDNRIFALKMFSKQITSSSAVQHFKREFKLLTRLHHPNLCTVYDYGTLDYGRSYFTMDYVDGEDIFETAAGSTYDNIYAWVVQLCRVLEYIHSKRLIHYDIKPGNVLVHRAGSNGDKDVVKLMDFGLTGEEQMKGGLLIKGTFPYIAPEVIKGLAVDHRADLYSLGVVLYEMFTRKSFQTEERESFVTLLKQRTDLVYRAPSKIIADIPQWLEQLIMRLLSFESAVRFSRANEVIKEINKFSRSQFALETEKTIEGYLLSSRFVGRDKEMGLLTSLYEKARRGDGKVVIVTGDPGVGKSRLLKEFKVFTQLQRSHSFMGQVYKGKIGPLEPFFDIISELINHLKARGALSRFRKIRFALAVLFKIFPDLTDGHLKKGLPKLAALGPQQEKLRNFEALLELIGYSASMLGEVVILLEDLHWADDLSIQCLEYLGRNVAGRNIFICGTCRKEDLKNNVALKNLVSHLTSKGCLNQIALKPLTFKSLYAFLDSTITPESNSSELVRYLLKKTGGNPYFVEELMRTLLLQQKMSIGQRLAIQDFEHVAIPGSIEKVISVRFKDLCPNSQEVVKYASIFLKGFNYDVMKRLTTLQDAELSSALWELKRRQVLIEEENKYRFYHIALREAINKRLGDKERSDLNYRIGRTLEKINRGRLNKVVEDLAYYFINAKDRKKGVMYGLHAAKKSGERYANEQAIRLYKGVLGLIGSKNPKKRFDILQQLAKIEILIGLYSDAIQHFQTAINLKIGTVDKKVRIYFGISDVYVRRGEYIKALKSYRKGLRLLRKIKKGSLKNLLEAFINVKICSLYFQIGDYKSANKFNLDDVQLPKGDFKGKEAKKLQAGIYLDLGTIESIRADYGEGDYDKAIYYHKEAYKYYKRMKDEYGVTTVLNDLGVNYQYKFDHQNALKYFQMAMQISEKIGDQYGVSVTLLNIGIILRTKGEHAKAFDCVQKALSISKKIGNPSMTGASLFDLGNYFLRLCNYKKAKEHLEKALNIFLSIGWLEIKIPSVILIGRVYQAMGNYTTALKFYRKALKISRDIRHQPDIAKSFFHMSSVFIDIGDFFKAKKYAEKASGIATAIRSKNTEVECCLHLCRISMMMKDYITAMNYYKKGIEITKKLEAKPELLHYFILVLEIYYNEKKYTKGMKLLNKAIKLAKEMGTKDLYIEVLLMKIKHGIAQGILSKAGIFEILDEALRVAEEIDCPEMLWKVYFEYGKFYQNNKEYLLSLDYYQKCVEVLMNVSSKINNKSYKQSYLSRPDRRAVFIAIDAVERLM